jgi:hypothetical protein
LAAAKTAHALTPSAKTMPGIREVSDCERGGSAELGLLEIAVFIDCSFRFVFLIVRARLGETSAPSSISLYRSRIIGDERGTLVN